MIRKLFTALLILAVVGVAILWRRSRMTSDLLAIRSPGGHLQVLASHRGRIVAFSSDMPFQTEHGGSFAGVSAAAEELDSISDSVFDRTAAWRSSLGFKLAAGKLSPGPAGSNVAYRAIRVPHWAALSIAISITLLLLRASLRRRRWAKTGRCSQCGYDLRESPGRCPESGFEGTAMRGRTPPRGGRVGGLVIACGALLATSVSLDFAAAGRAASSSHNTSTALRCPMGMAIPEVQFDDVELRDVAEFLGDVLNVPVRLDESSLASVGVTPHTPVNAKIRNQKVSTALRTILDSFPTRVEAMSMSDGSGGIMFTADKPKPCLEVYDIGQLVHEDGTKASEELVDEIVSLISDSIDPDSWVASGGNIGRIWHVRGRLIVVQTPENQRSVERLVTNLHESRQYTGYYLWRELTQVRS